MKLRAMHRKAKRSIPKPPPVLDCARAEGVYPGLPSHWREAQVMKPRAERFLNKLFGDVLCIGCEKRPDQVGQLFTKGRALVRDSCVCGTSTK
jgi:hypothetical protein